jgi:hypothetical protein
MGCASSKIKNSHDITEWISVGNRRVSYDEYQIIINANYPQNGVKHHESSYETYEIKNDQHIFAIGLIDQTDDSSYFLESMKYVIESIEKIKPTRKILFHCYAGVSRSVALCLGYMKTIYPHKTLKELFIKMKRKRPIINSRGAFVDELSRYFNDDSLLQYYTEHYTMKKAVLCNDGFMIKRLHPTCDVNQCFRQLTHVSFTLLDIACRQFCDESIKALLECGCSIQSQTGLSPFYFYANYRKPSIDMIDLFLQNGASLSQRDSRGNSFLYYIAKEKENETDDDIEYKNNLINMLVDRGADFSIILEDESRNRV